MKTKLLLASLILITSMSLGSFSSAQIMSGWLANVVDTEEIYDQVVCDTTSKIYLNQDNDADTLKDYGYYLNSNFQLDCTSPYVNYDYAAAQLIKENTTVKYYTPLFNMLYKINQGGQISMIDEYTFFLASRVFPCNTPVRGIATTPNKVIFEQPSDNDATKKIVSIRYDYTFKHAVGFDGHTTSAYRYNPVPTMNYFLNTNIVLVNLLPWDDGNRKREWSSLKTTNNCHNYELHRCGDGTIDTPSSSYVELFTWEICDDGDENGQPGKCDINCGLVWLWGYCGDGITENIAQVRPPYLDTLPAEIVTQLGVEFDSLAEGQTEVCDTWPSNPNDWSWLWFDGECTLACLIAPTIAPEIGFEE